MTTIVYREGLLVSDTRAYSGCSAPIGTKQKIHRHRDGSLFGISTNAPGLSEELTKWFHEDKHPDYFPPFGGDESWTAIEVKKDGGVFYFSGRPTPSGPLDTTYIAIGSGTDNALGALAMGADAPTAVLVASMFDQWTNDMLICLSLDGPEGDWKGRPSVELSMQNPEL